MEAFAPSAPLEPTPAPAASRAGEAGERSGEGLDPRIRRTRELLQQSLGDLLAAKDFDRISVHEITDAAGVNRATFYAHYNDKFALLECMVATRFHALLDDRGIVVAGGCANALRGLVIGLCDYISGATCPSQAPASRLLQPHMETALVAVLRSMILEGLTQHEPTAADSPTTEIRAAALAWAIYGATRESLKPADHPPAETIASTVITLVAPLFATA